MFFVLVSIVYCGCLTVESKPISSGGFFMWPGVFSPHESVFLRVLQDLNWMFFTASAKGFSHTCSDPNLPNEMVDLSWRSSTLLSPLKHSLAILELSCAKLHCHLTVFGWGGLGNIIRGGLLVHPLTLSIPGESGQCGLLTWPPGVRLHLSTLQQDTTDWGKSHNAQHSPSDC